MEESKKSFFLPVGVPTHENHYRPDDESVGSLLVATDGAAQLTVRAEHSYSYSYSTTTATATATATAQLQLQLQLTLQHSGYSAKYELTETKQRGRWYGTLSVVQVVPSGRVKMSSVFCRTFGIFRGVSNILPSPPKP